jgi:uncharacterized protein (DUF433 family)
MYAMSHVDRLLGLYPGTARRWVDGYRRSGKAYKPVVREESTGDDIVTWGEFVETRLLAEYRTSGIPMVHMRPVVERLRALFGPYPLARAKPYFDPDSREIVYRAQVEIGLNNALRLVVVARSGQVVLSGSARSFTDAADWGDDVVRRLHPGAKGSPVVLDPLMAFGDPSIRGVRTEVLAEQHRAGDPVWFLAETYSLSEEHVKAALAYERVA